MKYVMNASDSIVCVQWTENPECCPRLWRGTHADQIWYLGLDLSNEVLIVAHLFLPVVFRSLTSLHRIPFVVFFCYSIKDFTVWGSEVARLSGHCPKSGLLGNVCAVEVLLEVSSELSVFQWLHKINLLIWQQEMLSFNQICINLEAN